MIWTIKYDKGIKKDLKNLDKKTCNNILSFIEKDIKQLPDPRNLGTPLIGNLKGLWRYRKGDYRIIARIDDSELLILVIKIAHRKKIYKV